MKNTIKLFMLLAMLLMQTVSAADIKEIGVQLDKIAKYVKKKGITDTQYKDFNKSISDYKLQINSCISENESLLEKIKESLASLGEAAKADPPEVKKKRKELNAEVTSVEKQLSSCKLLALKSDDLEATISGLYKTMMAQTLFARTDTVITIIRNNLAQPLVWFDASKEFVKKNSGIVNFTITGVLLYLVLFSVVAVLINNLRKSILEFLGSRHKVKSFSEKFVRAVISTFGHYLPHIVLSAITALYAYSITRNITPVPFVSELLYGLPVYFVLLATIHLLLAPYKPAEEVFGFTEHIAKAFAARLKVLLTMIYIGYLFFSTIVAESLPDLVLLLGREIFAVLFIVNLIWMVWLFRSLPNASKTFYLRSLVLLALICVLIVELSGYRNLSVQSLRIMFGTAFVVGLTLLIQRLLRDMFSGLKLGTQKWHRAVRQLFGLYAKDHFPGLLWIQAISHVGLWVIMGFLVLRIWGLSDTALDELREYLIHGFTIGSLRIIPLKIVMAVVSLALLLSFSGWFKGRLEKKWLPETRIERGSREAIVSISGYTGAILAALVALGITGVDFSNLAIIAGALSVGIGFGLQNIVNNFVSGIILLLERPIKTGDWVVVGATEGNVKKIRIRSTQIQTFDRADVVVPNSELISGQVTNWMLRDAKGRARIPVGVAYGSDTEKVKEILLDIAAKHPEVISDDPTRESRVLFRAFGDSSLDFELRCHILNIDKRLTVVSDINFAIDKAFRENQIEIPFPQRDLHVRSGLHTANNDNE